MSSVAGPGGVPPKKTRVRKGRVAAAPPPPPPLPPTPTPLPTNSPSLRLKLNQEGCNPRDAGHRGSRGTFGELLLEIFHGDRPNLLTVTGSGGTCVRP